MTKLINELIGCRLQSFYVLFLPSHYDLYSAFNNANCVKAALHQHDINQGGFFNLVLS